jgi:hypothetical protein
MTDKLFTTPHVWRLRFTDIEGRTRTLLIVRDDFAAADKFAAAIAKMRTWWVVAVTLVGPLYETTP